MKVYQKWVDYTNEKNSDVGDFTIKINTLTEYVDLLGAVQDAVFKYDKLLNNSENEKDKDYYSNKKKRMKAIEYALENRFDE